MITPNYLEKGDKIAIVAPAKFIPQGKYHPIIKYIDDKGYKVVRGKSTYLEHGPFAGSDEERRDDLQNALDDKEIKAVFCLRGGYGTIRIIEGIDFSKFIQNPKWLVGFSDITILHSKLTNLGIESIHGQMPVNFAEQESMSGVAKLFETLEGQTLEYAIKPNPNNVAGNASAEIVGGNFAILCSLIGTPYDINTAGKILFIEEVGEYLYRFDRMMFQLKLSGKLDNLAGLIIGGLSNMEDNEPKFPLSEFEIVKNHIKDLKYPVCFGFPAGHVSDNFPLIMGRNVIIQVNELQTKISFKK
ncbi:MAG: LD-carboxypeptidase [Salinivirgaceae bacterium]|nr:LD-carboxypeptidase [Salinivirgaceae bacterium]